MAVGVALDLVEVRPDVRGREPVTNAVLPDASKRVPVSDGSHAYHVTLVRPPFIVSPRALVGSAASPSLALAMLGAVCLEQGYGVTAIDAVGERLHHYRPIPGSKYFTHGLNAAEIINRIPSTTDLIGITCMFSNEWFHHRTIVDDIHAAFPQVPIVMGGEHVTAAAEYVLKCCPGVRACVLGEGEETLLELIDALRAGRSLKNVAGIFFRDQVTGEVVRTAPRKRMREIDRLPWPAWDLTPIRAYIDAGTTHGVTRRRAMPILASRGCPYQCAFCSSPQMWGTLWNFRNPVDVVAEIKYYRDVYGVDTISFHDLTAIIRRKWILEFARLLEQEVPGITWTLPSGTRSEALDGEVLTAMRRSGCYQIVLAPESGSKRTLQSIKKKVDPDRLLDVVRVANRTGIHTRANIIFGFPDEPPREMLITLLYIVRLAWAGMDDIAPGMFCPYPGSELHEHARRLGMLPEEGPEYDLFLADNIVTDFTTARTCNKYLKGWQLQLLVLFSLFVFYGFQYLFRPWRPFASLRRLLNGKPVTTIERVLFIHMERYRRFARAST
jgi:radical SAM superfamily enzyme YgiQ (UPF0313 family)